MLDYWLSQPISNSKVSLHILNFKSQEMKIIIQKSESHLNLILPKIIVSESCIIVTVLVNRGNNIEWLLDTLTDIFHWKWIGLGALAVIFLLSHVQWKLENQIYYQKQIYYLCTGSHLRNLFVWGCDGLMNAGKPGLVCVDEGLLV